MGDGWGRGRGGWVGQGREGKGREGREGWVGQGRAGKGREGKGREMEMEMEMEMEVSSSIRRGGWLIIGVVYVYVYVVWGKQGTGCARVFVGGSV